MTSAACSCGSKGRPGRFTRFIQEIQIWAILGDIGGVTLKTASAILDAIVFAGEIDGLRRHFGGGKRSDHDNSH